MEQDDLKARIGQLEAEAKQRDEKLKELQSDHDDAIELVDKMRAQVEDYNALIDQWIEVFEMQQDGDGTWIFADKPLWDSHDSLRDDHAKLLRDWNRFVAEYNAEIRPRERGRPLAASDHQVRQVRKLQKDGRSLRVIARQTALGLRTVRTIIEQGEGRDRTAKHTNLVRRREIDRLRAAAWRVRKRGYDEMPKKITKTRATGAELVKAAKGIGRKS